MKNIGLYIHVPFCRKKCPYCDFYSLCPNDDMDLMERYTKSVIAHLSEYKSRIENKADTLYFGGGTPSFLGADRLCRIISHAKELFLVENSEITVECNPSDDLSVLLPQLSQVGVNRISIGMQSAVNEERLALGRSAEREDIRKAIEIARNSGIDNISLDLMLGIPHMTLASLKSSLDFIEELGVLHVSAYMLKIEEGTPFYKNADKLLLPDEDLVCDMYLMVEEELKKAGLYQYEVSNFSKAGFESKHNLKYWECEEYLGIGPSAHSFISRERFFYLRDLNRFLSEAPPILDGYGGDREERIMLALRLSKGIHISMLSDKALSFIPDLVKGGLAEEKNSCVNLTAKGFLLSNSIINMLSQ